MSCSGSSAQVGRQIWVAEKKIKICPEYTYREIVGYIVVVVIIISYLNVKTRFLCCSHCLGLLCASTTCILERKEGLKCPNKFSENTLCWLGEWCFFKTGVNYALRHHIEKMNSTNCRYKSHVPSICSCNQLREHTIDILFVLFISMFILSNRKVFGKETNWPDLLTLYLLKYFQGSN